VLLDTADTTAILDTDSDVTINTPGGGPGVLNEVVFLTVQSTVTNGKDGVIEEVTTTLSKDTTSEGLESVLVGLDGDSNRLFSESGLKLRGALLGDGGVGSNTNVTGLVLARTILSSVLVLRLVVDLVGLGVLESIVLPATVATVVTVGGGAINELLLGKRDEVAGLDGVGTFHGTSG